MHFKRYNFKTTYTSLFLGIKDALVWFFFPDRIKVPPQTLRQNLLLWGAASRAALAMGFVQEPFLKSGFSEAFNIANYS